ncbi:MAG TPA: alpha/beta hydrolase [Gammaproteobacteria bacterium]
MNVSLKPWCRLLAAALLPLILAACIPDEIKAEVIEEAEENDDDDFMDALSCATIELTLVADLPVSEKTAENAYEALSFMDWCARNIASKDLKDFVGNATAWDADETDPLITATSPSGSATRPTLAQGARLEIHVLRPQGTIPFVRKIHFMDWTGPDGTCALEMRVYQENLGETGKKPLLYFHGGGWRNRSTTMTAAEILTPHLLDEHVVFMPAYPLHDDKDGPAECRHAGFDDILESAQRAFDWVVANKNLFGATGAETIDVMGHSAGGQLAAYIATQNRARAGKLVNFYGPVELADFIDQSREHGRYADSFDGAKSLLASLLEVDDLAGLERPYGDAVMQSSLSEIIAASGAGAVPPFFMVQGNADETVPVEQAILACNALGGSASPAGGIYACGSNSRVAIIGGAGHNLDRRCAGGKWPGENEDVETMMDTVCPDDEGNDEEVRAAVTAAFEWLDE